MHDFSALPGAERQRQASYAGAVAIYEVLILEQVANLGAYHDPLHALEIYMEARRGTHFSTTQCLSDILFCDLIARRGGDEFDLQRRFFELLPDLLPGAKQHTGDINPKHQPDGFVVYDGAVLPVEVKLKAFDDKALSQLRRYMTIYNCAHGVAVAATLECKPPKSVIFIPLSLKDRPRPYSPEVQQARTRILADCEALRRIHAAYAAASASRGAVTEVA